MLDSAALRPATSEEIADSLSFAPRYDGRKRAPGERHAGHTPSSKFE